MKTKLFLITIIAAMLLSCGKETRTFSSENDIMAAEQDTFWLWNCVCGESIRGEETLPYFTTSADPFSGREVLFFEDAESAYANGQRFFRNLGININGDNCVLGVKPVTRQQAADIQDGEYYADKAKYYIIEGIRVPILYQPKPSSY